MRLLVPFDGHDPKSRLADVLDDRQRRAFAGCMLRDVLDALRAAGRDPEVLATTHLECVAPVHVDERPLTPAVNAVLDATAEPVAVVMADLPLLTVDAIERLFRPDAAVVIAPGLGGGTNALLVDHPGFRVDYHGLSYRDHRDRARRCGAAWETVDSFRLACDVDDADGITELLLHGEGRAAEWLREEGFELGDGGDLVGPQSSQNSR